MKESNSDFILKNFLKIAIAILIILSFVFILYPFFIPLILGGILAMAFSPFVKYFMARGWSRKFSVLIISFTILILGLTPVTIVLMRGTKIVTHFLSEQSIVMTKHKLEDRAYAILDNLADIYNIDQVEAHEKFDNAVSNAGTWLLQLFTRLLSELPNLAMLVFITILTFYFFLIDEARIRKWFDRYFHFTTENGNKFITLIKSSCNEIFFSNVLTGFIQATIVATGAFFTDTGDVFIVFFSAFFLSFIPVIGAAPVAFIVAVLAFLDSRIGAGIGMAIVGLVAGVTDNLVRPYLSSRGEVNVPIYVSFLSIIGGVIILGLPGLFVGPLLASLAYGALPIIFAEFFDTGVTSEPVASDSTPEVSGDQPRLL